MNNAKNNGSPPAWIARCWSGATRWWFALSWTKRLLLTFIVSMEIDVILLGALYFDAAVSELHIPIALTSTFAISWLIVHCLLAAVIICSILKAVLAMLPPLFKVLDRLLTLDKIKQALNVTALAYPVFVAFSIIYEATYFHALDLSILAIPMPLTDLLDSSLLWTRYMFISLIVSYVILPVVILSVEEMLLPCADKDFVRATRWLKRFTFPPTLIVLTICGFFFLWSFDIDSWDIDLTFLIFLASLIPLFIIMLYINRRLFPEGEGNRWNNEDRGVRTTQVIWASTVWFILLLLFQWNIALSYAENSTLCTGNLYTFNFTDGASKEGRLVRSFSDYLLIRDCDCGNLEFLNSDEVHSIVKH